MGPPTEDPTNQGPGTPSPGCKLPIRKCVAASCGLSVKMRETILAWHIGALIIRVGRGGIYYYNTYMLVLTRIGFQGILYRTKLITGNPPKKNSIGS